MVRPLMTATAVSRWATDQLRRRFMELPLLECWRHGERPAGGPGALVPY